jgi:hypothetical protein
MIMLRFWRKETPMAKAKHTEHPKIGGQFLANFHGLTIYGNHHAPKLRGKHRIWIQIRQDEPKALRVAECLSYMRSVDIQFEQG